MEKFDIYNDIAKRTKGDIYIGVVGPVRSGKSSFIRKFMEKLVIPVIADKNDKKVAIDELPQSAAGKTIMTTQPKFVPAEAVSVKLGASARAKVRLIDCVGYLIDGAIGHEENDKPRQVKTPWSDGEMPFEKAAELGTKKVINDHSTIGILVTTDGTISDIPRASYIKAEERVVKELKQIGKPFAIVLNSAKQESDEAKKLRSALKEKYGAPVVLLNVQEMSADDVKGVLEEVLYEFPLRSIDLAIPKWMQVLPASSKIISEILGEVQSVSPTLKKMRDYELFEKLFTGSERLISPKAERVELGEGRIEYSLSAKPDLFYEVLSEECGDKISGEYELMSYVKSLSTAKAQYLKIKDALKDAVENGYGVVNPTIEEMRLEEPELVKQGGRYGVKLRASAPSLHIMKVDVYSEVSPIVGTEKEGEELVSSIMSEFENDPKSIWETQMFGKSLHSIVREGLTNKLVAMPQETQGKMRKTVGKIVNEGKGGVICILL